MDSLIIPSARGGTLCHPPHYAGTVSMLCVLSSCKPSACCRSCFEFVCKLSYVSSVTLLCLENTRSLQSSITSGPYSLCPIKPVPVLLRHFELFENRTLGLFVLFCILSHLNHSKHSTHVC